MKKKIKKLSFKKETISELEMSNTVGGYKRFSVIPCRAESINAQGCMATAANCGSLTGHLSNLAGIACLG
ncbi:MAG: TIGR04149 family rSAM-modified RiPP [Flavobacteriales bacterium]